MDIGIPPTGQDKPTDGEGTDLLSTAGGWVADSISGLPAPIRKNAWKAFGQLCTAAIQYPVAILEGAAKEKIAETNARIKLIEQSAEQISRTLNVDPAFGSLAAQKYANKIVREQINIEKIVKVAVDDINASPPPDSKASDASISDDWLNSFEKEASQKSSEEMQLLFGRILAGEIKRPRTFSIHTVRMIGQLDSKVAELFVKFCSLSITLGLDEQIIDVRILVLDKTASANGLKEFGLNYSNLTLLQEHGLVTATLDSTASYKASIIKDGKRPMIPIKYIGKYWGFKAATSVDNSPVETVRGVALTKAGRELSMIVDIQPDAAYSSELMKKFAALGFDMVQV